MATTPSDEVDAGRTWLTEHGDSTSPQREVLRTVVGSGVHGIAVEGSDDHDEMGVCVEHPRSVLGVGHVDGHYVARTVPEGHRSHHGDVDLVLYSLRRYLALVMTGNPTALLPLFTPPADVVLTTPLGERLRALGPQLLSQRAGHRFLGYLRSQRERMLGAAAGAPNRPELVAAHGYDTKYASHALRLAVQGLEVARQGRLTLPVPEPDRQLVLSVKRGERTQEQSLALIDARAAELEELLASGRSPLPEHPDLDAVSAWSTAEHLRYWSEHDLLG
ncbi:nucleotidyltransferase [Streptomyces sp. NP160]|uniref:nucleotidyltransferase domain-containing protein n=1 Tax=Streptomyces sp. NP160 TaxID=2586637 RepID=UPI00111A69EC|nr:nucleotidyltransferase domain-containing protein [Streptomyces sp. NP160]TNM64174.1 nucleotidyltransferase [Streptomyces sp. NP160]